MRKHLLFSILTLYSSAALAQQPAAQGAAPAAKLFAGSADVTAMMAKAKSERKADQPNFIQPIVQLAPYTANLEYRVGGVKAPASVHEREAEMFYVVEGSGTLVTGGKLKDEKRTNAENLTGAGYGLVVPAYVADAGVKGLKDLGPNKDKFGGKIYGIEPGTVDFVLWPENSTAVDPFHTESSAVLAAGLASSGYQQLDETSTRVNGQNYSCHVLTTPAYTAYRTTDGKDRLSVVRALTDQQPLGYRLNARVLTYLAEQGLAAKWRTLLAAWPHDQSWTATELAAATKVMVLRLRHAQ